MPVLFFSLGKSLYSRIISFIFALTIIHFVTVASNPKREFRGAWLHTVAQNHFAERDAAGNQSYLSDQLDKMQYAGINAVIFHVRPVSDAFYYSEIEPWSKYLTGEIGKEPDEFWDPLEFMTEECHARGMEVHAWLNPYRSVPTDEVVPDDHITKTEPWRFIVFNGRYYFDPGLPENRAYIDKIVRDIVTRYDVDAIHMDDYFYPYPVRGIRFNDEKSFQKYGNGLSRNDWRRQNVNLLIEQLGKSIHSIKPWVRFGISPFGIWRNIASDPKGSQTNGLQNYDDLYADVRLWARKGWIDYQVPQLYWELDHKKASSRLLADWWNTNAFDRDLYFGQDVERTMNKNELLTKIEISRRLPNVGGNVWWPSVSVTKDYMDVMQALHRGAQSTIAIPPVYKWLDPDNQKTKLTAPTDLSVDDGVLSWRFPENSLKENDCSNYAGVVIYKSDKFGSNDTTNPENILAVVRGEDNFWVLDENIKPGTILFVTALDRINRETETSIPVTVL